jgi:hypothetical protein
MNDDLGTRRMWCEVRMRAFFIQRGWSPIVAEVKESGACVVLFKPIMRRELVGRMQCDLERSAISGKKS